MHLVGSPELPDGTRVRGRRQPLPAGPRPEFGLWPGRPGTLPDRPVEQLDWADFR